MLPELIGFKVSMIEEATDQKIQTRIDRLFLCLFNLCFHHRTYDSSIIFIQPVVEKFIETLESYRYTCSNEDLEKCKKSVERYIASFQSSFFRGLIPQQYTDRLRMLL
jgi:hypothetical protein